MSLIFSSCCWSANEPLSFGIQKAHARRTTRAKAITPTNIAPFFPKGNTCHQLFLLFIAGCIEQAKCQVATNDKTAIFKGRQDFPSLEAAKIGTARCKIYRRASGGQKPAASAAGAETNTLLLIYCSGLLPKALLADAAR